MARWLQNLHPPAQSRAACFLGTRFAADVFHGKIFGWDPRFFLEFFPTGPARCIRFHCSHHAKAAQFAALVPAFGALFFFGCM
jgi:hypothetical protein